VLFQYLDCAQLAGSNWCGLELRRLQTAESVIYRTVRAIPKLFRNNPCELFVPLVERNFETYTLSAGEFLWVRSADRRGLLRIRTVSGVGGLLIDGPDPKSIRTISVPDTFIQEQLAATEAIFRARSSNVFAGSFVRVLNGHGKNYCGVVTALDGEKVTVEISLRSKQFVLETYRVNCLSLDHVDENRRVYFYCPAVADIDPELLRSKPEEEAAVEEDESVLAAGEHNAPDRVSRKFTISAALREIVNDGCLEPQEVVRQLVEKIASGQIPRLPINVKIIYDFVKSETMKRVPTHKDWRTYMATIEPTARVNLRYVDQVLRDSGIVLPMFTPESEIRQQRPRKKH
jgi:hypothetical protein